MFCDNMCPIETAPNVKRIRKDSDATEPHNIKA